MPGNFETIGLIAVRGKLQVAYWQMERIFHFQNNFNEQPTLKKMYHRCSFKAIQAWENESSDRWYLYIQVFCNDIVICWYAQAYFLSNRTNILGFSLSSQHNLSMSEGHNILSVHRSQCIRNDAINSPGQSSGLILCEINLHAEYEVGESWRVQIMFPDSG